MIQFLITASGIIVAAVGLVATAILAVKVAENGIEPRFPCIECEHFEGNHCKRCVEGVSGEPRLCTYARGTLRCITGARRQRREID